MPIRHLLKELPNHCQQNSGSSALAPPNSDDSVWTTAHWDALAIGLSVATQGAMGPVLARVPGIAGQQAQPTSSCRQPIWHTLKTHSDEQAVLLFCPTPTRALPDEATWRLLAQLCQTPFYTRMRSEERRVGKKGVSTCK